MIAPTATAPAPLVTHPSGIPYTRPATIADDAFVEELHAIAFGPGRFARTAFRVRERFAIDESLSLIAEVDGVPCGSVWMTPISVGGINGYLLGPLATHPDFRKRGAGKLLAREVTANALAKGAGQFVLLIGDQDYYCPLGWRLTTPGAVVFPGPVDYDRVLAFTHDPQMAAALAGHIAAFG